MTPCISIFDFVEHGHGSPKLLNFVVMIITKRCSGGTSIASDDADSGDQDGLWVMDLHTNRSKDCDNSNKCALYLIRSSTMSK